MSLIQVSNLTKEFKVAYRQPGILGTIRSLLAPQYEIKQAVKGVTFTIEQGETVGYIGPNGAGKSTSIKMLTGILVPTSGKIIVAGLVPHVQRKEHVRHIGAVFGQKSQLWWDVPVIESLMLLKEIYNVPKECYRSNMEIFQDLLDLHEFQNIPVRQLSLGQRMRADLAAALLHNPDILFLDEPTIGVDVLAKERFRIFIRTLNREKGVTVLLTTHDIADIERLCQRMMIIDHGQVIYNGPVTDMKERFMPYRILEVEFEEGFREPLQGTFQIKGQQVEVVEQYARQVRLRFDRRTLSASELITTLAQRYSIKDISLEEPEVEAIVRDIYERGIT